MSPTASGNLKDILNGAKYKSASDLSKVKVGGIAVDSRTVRRGDVFVAIDGYSIDSHKFIGDAVRKGAKAIVVGKDLSAPKGVVKVVVSDTRKALAFMAENFYSLPSEKLKVVGVTGTNGKTTVTYLLENIINSSGGKAGVVGTVNYRIGSTVIPSTNTTPGVLDLQSLLSRFVSERASYAVMEVSSHSLDQGRVGRILFDAGIITNVTRDHLDYHKTADDYFKAKAKLLGILKKDGCAVLNADDRRVGALKRPSGSRTLTYGLEGGADVTAEDISLSSGSSSFSVATPDYKLKMRSALIGRYNVSNILAAIAAAYALGIDAASVKEGIESFTSVPGRLEPIDAGQPFRVFVDFAHTEDALSSVLTMMRKIATRKVITIFGCGGNRDKTKRPRMGRVACEMSDAVVLTSDNPRFEDPVEIIKEIETGIKGRFYNYCIEVDRKDAIVRAMGIAGKDDIVLIAGKGHENTQIIGDRNLPFDDREVARSVLGSIYGKV